MKTNLLLVFVCVLCVSAFGQPKPTVKAAAQGLWADRTKLLSDLSELSSRADAIGREFEAETKKENEVVMDSKNITARVKAWGEELDKFLADRKKFESSPCSPESFCDSEIARLDKWRLDIAARRTAIDADYAKVTARHAANKITGAAVQARYAQYNKDVDDARKRQKDWFANVVTLSKDPRIMADKALAARAAAPCKAVLSVSDAETCLKALVGPAASKDKK